MQSMDLSQNSTMKKPKSISAMFKARRITVFLNFSRKSTAGLSAALLVSSSFTCITVSKEKIKIITNENTEKPDSIVRIPTIDYPF